MNTMIRLFSLFVLPLALMISKAAQPDNKPRLGMSSASLEQLWGKGAPANDFNIERRDGPDDKDYLLYRDLNKDCTALQWVLPKGEKITGIFYRDACIGFEVRLPRPSVKQGVKYAETLLPGVKLSNRNFNRNGAHVTYSSDPEKTVKFQNGDGFFDLKDLKAMRQRLKELNLPAEESDRELEERINGDIAALTQKITTGMTGKSLDELRKSLGPQSTQSAWANLPESSVGWEQGSIRLNAIFVDEICTGFVIQSRDNLMPWQALELAQSLTPGFRFESRHGKDNKTPFAMVNIGVNKRYNAQWQYDDKLKLFVLIVSDMKLLKDLKKKRK